jgi:acyl-CoA dehydrogenase
VRLSRRLRQGAHRRRLAGALIPEQYGGGGLSVTEASVILEEINRSGANSGACHAQMYIMGALLRHGSEEQKRHTCRASPPASCACSRSPSPSRPPAPTHEDAHDRRPHGDRYIVNGQKVWISRIQHSDLMLLLARTTPLPR